jgi:hypothetical protein
MDRTTPVLLSLLGCASCMAQPSRDPYDGTGILRRLSHREYDNVARDLLGDASHPSALFPAEQYPAGFDNGPVALAVGPDEVDAYATVAERLASTADLSALIAGCDPKTSGPQVCKRAFFDGFVKRAFRRPPTRAEEDALDAVYQVASSTGCDRLASTGGPALPDRGPLCGTFELAIRSMTEAVLQSPGFIYREELGDPRSGRPTPYEIASSISFSLVGSMPDDLLLQAADEGRLVTLDDVRREGARLLEAAGARANLGRAVQQWLALDRLKDVAKDPALYPSFGTALARSMGAEIDALVESVIFERSGTLRELFTTTDARVDPPLAALYGIQTSTAADAQEVSLDPATRKGVLTRAAYLAVHSEPDSSAPVTRGVFLREAILCAPLPPPPPDALNKFNSEPQKPNETTRHRFERHATDPRCSGCHQLIDGVGFAFEQFDAVGALRTIENGQPIDTSGQLIGTDVDGPVIGASELSERLMGSHQVEGCFVKQIFRFVSGRGEDAGDRAMLDRLATGFSVDSRVQELLLTAAAEIALSPHALEVK